MAGNRRFAVIVRIIVFSMALMTALYTGSSGAQGAQSGRRWALVVGINDYKKEVTPLRCAVQDAQVFRKVLVESAGFDDGDVFLLTSDQTGYRVPERTNIIRWISYIKQNVDKNDTFIFFFSGHGMDTDKGGYLLTMDADPYSVETLDSSSLKISDLKKSIEEMKVARTVLFIDACRNDPRSGKGDAKNPLSDRFSKNLIIRQSTKEKDQSAFSATFFSCKVGERSYEWSEKSMGFFSYFLAAGLMGEALDEKGKVSIDSLDRFISQRVFQAVKRERGEDQTPWVIKEGSSGTGSWIMALSAGSAAKHPSQTSKTSDPVRSASSSSGKTSSLPGRENRVVAPLSRSLFSEGGSIDDNAMVSLLGDIYYNKKSAVEEAVKKDNRLVNAIYEGDIRDRHGWTPLNCAVGRNNNQIAEYLISKGANINKNDKCYDYTPLQWASMNGNMDMAKLLLDRGALIDGRDRKGQTALHLACRNYKKDLAELLISQGADLEATMDEELTPLLEVFAMGSTDQVTQRDMTGEMAAWLISKGAKLDAKCIKGFSALHVAAYSGNYSAVLFLISKGMDINARADEGKTPLSLALIDVNNDPHLDQQLRLVLPSGLSDASTAMVAEQLKIFRQNVKAGRAMVADLLRKKGAKQ
ncbi:MAG: ankyrin repeat domain-containing protein [Candidatus Xenobiia bacterium LiM19]